MTSPADTCVARSLIVIVPLPRQITKVSAGVWLCNIVCPPGSTRARLGPHGGLGDRGPRIEVLVPHVMRLAVQLLSGELANRHAILMFVMSPSVRVARLPDQPMPSISLPQHEILEGVPDARAMFTAESADRGAC